MRARVKDRARPPPSPAAPCVAAFAATSSDGVFTGVVAGEHDERQTHLRDGGDVTARTTPGARRENLTAANGGMAAIYNGSTCDERANLGVAPSFALSVTSRAGSLA